MVRRPHVHFRGPISQFVRIGILLSMLILFLAALSVWISTGIVFGYIVWRFFTLVRTDGRAGVSQWSAETRRRFRRQRKVEAEERRGRSSESVVMVKNEGEDKPSAGQPTNETVKQ